MSRILFLVVGLSMVFCEQRIFADDRTERTKADEIDKLIMRLRSKDTKTRVKAAETLSDMGENASPASEALCEAITAQSPQVATAALDAMQKVRPDLYTPLSTMILDGNENKQAAAIMELALMGEKAAPVLPVLRAKLRTVLAEDTVQGSRRSKACFDALQQIDPKDQETFKLLLVVASPQSRNSAAKLEAITLLCIIAGEDEASRKKILPVLKAGLDDRTCLMKCMEVLGEYGELAKDALPQLKKLKLSSEETVRKAANVAVDRIENP